MKTKNPTSRRRSLQKTQFLKEEAFETLKAIRAGEVDAFVISDEKGERIFRLESADYPYRLFVEEMNQGAVTLSSDGAILYCNKSITKMTGVAAEKILGRVFSDFISPADKQSLDIAISGGSSCVVEVFLKSAPDSYLPVSISIKKLQMGDIVCFCVVVTDLSHRKYRSIVDAQTELIFRWKDDFVLTFANDAFCRYFQKSPKELAGKVFLPFIYEPDREAFMRGISKVNPDEPIFKAESRVYLEKRGVRWMRWIHHGLFDERGKIMEFQTAAADITNRREAEERLARAEKRYRSLAENIPAVFMRFDKCQRVTYISPAVYSMIGIEPEKFIGKTNREVGLAPEQLLSQWEKAIGEVFHTAERRDIEFDLSVGEEIKSFCLRLVPEKGENGEVENVIGISTDVSERSKIFRELEKTKENLEGLVKERTGELFEANIILEKIFSVSNFLIAYLDTDFNYIRVNKAFADALGRDAGFFINKNHFALYPSWEQEEIFKNAVRSKQTHTAFDVSLFFLDPKGGQAWWDWTLQPVKDPSGNVQGLILVFIDVTERKKAEVRLHEAQRELHDAKRLADIGTLASTVAHELRNPLAAINMALGNIKRKAENVSILERQIHTIEKKTAESDRIIRNLLFYSRIRKSHRETVELYGVLEECLDQQALMVKNTVIIKKNFQGIKGLKIEADGDQMREFFFNVFHNAYDAMPEFGGRMEVKALLLDGFVKIFIKDNGSGISPEHLSEVFRPFFTTKPKGTGLGLTVCREIINQHRGSLTIESFPGQGTTVVVALPFKRQEELYLSSETPVLNTNS